MPLVTSQTLFTEKLNSCQARPDVNQNMQASPKSGRPAAVELSDLVSIICSRILTSDPSLVAEVAAGKSSRQSLTALISHIAEQESVRSGFFHTDLHRQVMDFLFGYGPLQPYIENEDISDIDGTGPAEFSMKENGQRQSLAVSFSDARAYDTFCRLVIIRNGGIINENDSHCRVTDERYRLRINVTVPPRSVNGATISVRKHRHRGWRLTELQDRGMLDSQLVSLLARLASSDATVLFCGKGAAGKTTLLRAFIQAMPNMERVLIAESDSEIYPEKPYCLVQRIKKPHEGGRPVSLRDLIADGLTMSLDTYCIGEIVGEEALEFLRAAFSGHRCLATTHADCAQDSLERLLSLALPAAHGESEKLLRHMLAKSIHFVVFLADFQVRQVIQINSCPESEDSYEMVEIWPACKSQTTDTSAGQFVIPLVPGP